jgi:hypothetical protein
MPQNAEASKREGQEQTELLVFCWEVTTYHTSISVAKDMQRFSPNGQWSETGARGVSLSVRHYM